MLKLNNELWNIKIVKPYDKNLMRSDGSYTLGVTDDNVKTIFISDGLDCDILKKVLIHECIHALMFSMDIYIDIYQEECLCNAIAEYGQYILNVCYDFLNSKCREE